MISVGSVSAVLGVVFSYLLVKNQTIKSSGQLQSEIENRLQPRYTVNEPLKSNILPHTDWPSDEIWFKIWHIEVYENRRGTWKKWLPRGSFNGSTVVTYEIHGPDLPPQESMQQHHLAKQPYVRNLKTDVYEPKKVEVTYDSASPSSISLFASQFEILLRDTIFREQNPNANLQHELVRSDDGQTYARIYDANKESS